MPVTLLRLAHFRPPNVERATRELGRDALCSKGLPVEPGREQCWVGFNLGLVVLLQADEGKPTVS
jgi:hypothetical protein